MSKIEYIPCDGCGTQRAWKGMDCLTTCPCLDDPNHPDFEPVIDIQAPICPNCFDDHSSNNTDYCIGNLKKEIDFLKEKLRELTDFYGDTKNWTNTQWTGEYPTMTCHKDDEMFTEKGDACYGGKLARKIKKEIFGDE